MYRGLKVALDVLSDLAFLPGCEPTARSRRARHPREVLPEKRRQMGGRPVCDAQIIFQCHPHILKQLARLDCQVSLPWERGPVSAPVFHLRLANHRGRPPSRIALLNSTAQSTEFPCAAIVQ